jgi:hypothetical protein
MASKPQARADPGGEDALAAEHLRHPGQAGEGAGEHHRRDVGARHRHAGRPGRLGVRADRPQPEAGRAAVDQPPGDRRGRQGEHERQVDAAEVQQPRQGGGVGDGRADRVRPALAWKVVVPSTKRIPNRAT